MSSRKYRIQKDLVFLTVSMFITVCLWIGFSIYDTMVTSTIDETLQIQIIPIDGRFDVTIIENLKNRQRVIPDLSDTQSSTEAKAPLVLTSHPEPTVFIPAATVNPELTQIPVTIQVEPTSTNTP